MAFDNSFTAVTGATYTAAQYNTHVKGNFASIWVGTTAGDLDYYTSGTAKARLGIGGEGSLLRSTGSAPAWLALGAQGAILRSNGTNPSWLAIGTSGQFLSSNGTNPVWTTPAAPKGLHTIGNVVFNPGGQNFNGTAGTYSNITGASFNLTLSVTCTVVVFAVVVGYNSNAGNSFVVRSVINSVADPSATFPFNGGATRNEALPYIHYATGVTAGTRAVVLQCENSPTTNTVERGRMIALAFAE